ncbi:MAG: Ig-like domain-containing protein [Rhodanobacteraceae bacterium]|nr:Ig-like domain-containing protein [Rhodanobacteraceae bacterium]
MLSYTPAANANGVATITLRARDDGGTANGGVDASAPQTFTITVNAINDAPSFTVGPNQTVNEDAAAQTVNPWATALNDGDPELTQALSFVITANSNAALFSTAPAVSPTGVLTYTPAANANGSATITLRIQDDGSSTPPNVNTSATQTFTITVNPVNDAPTLTAVSPPTVLEDAGPQTVANWAAFNPGPADEAGQTVLGYQISAISNAALFAVPPAVANNGTLTYTPAANANGSSTFVARVQDSGGTANGGVDLSVAQTFTITVTAINDVPSFTVGTNQTVLEDAGAQTVGPWATAINDGDPEVTQVLAFTITANTNAALFSAAPSVSPTGVLSYTPAANANGSATITLRLQDDGSNTPPNVNTSATQTFTITVTPVNDAPSFAVGISQTVPEDAAAQTVNPWATAISAGPADEAAQTLTFNVTGNTNAALFSAQPAISPAGVLTYTPAANASGVATITLTLSDNGLGAPPPNANTSAPQTFTITVNAVNDAPVNTVPGAQTTGDTVPLVLSTANTNALSVADIDAAAGIVQMSFGTGAAANGTLTLANPGGVLTTLTGNGTQQVIATGTLTALNTALNGPSGSLTYTPVAGTTAARTITVITNDQGNTGSGGAQIDTDLITVNVDAPPVVTSNPANGATIANNAAIVVNFSELVTVSPGITLTCGGPNLITGGATGAAVTTLNLTYTAPLPAGSCTLTVPNTSVADDDGIDPPHNPLTTYSATFTVDAAPRVTTTTPAAGATTSNNVALQVNFNEPVTATNAVTLTCTLGAVPLAGTSGIAITVLNPTYGGALPPGLCTLTVVAANVNDTDVADPPSQLDGDDNGVDGDNFVITFTVDDAPAFVSATPGAAAVVGTGQTVSFTYNENVIDLGGAITLSCNAVNVPGTTVAAGATLTFTPTALTPGQNCTATAVALQIGDADSFDPPQNPVINQTINFSVDTAPDFSSSVPASNAINVGLSANLSVTFTEPVNFTASAFTLNCPGGSPVAFTVSGSGSNTAIIDPTPPTLPINTVCVLTVDDAQVTDVDSADPPDTGTGITTISFTTVNDNPPTVTTNPANGAANVALNGNITVSFNEPVTLTGAWFQLNCPTSGVRTSTGELSGTGVNIIENTPDLVYTIDPIANLANGESCAITIDSANVVDNDAIDPPNELDGNASGDTTDGDADDYVAQFTTPDVAPTVTSTPAAGATVPNTQTVTLNFSEQVNVAAGAIAFNCGAAVTFTPALPQSGISTLTLTPGAALPNGANCTVTLESTLITDVDAIDPPNQLDGNSSGDLVDGDADDFALTFSVDAQPSIVAAEVEVVNVFTALPLGVGVFADSDTNLRLSFSEAVNPTANWASLTCVTSGTQSVGGGTLAVTAADPVFTLNPVTNLTPGESCTLTVFAAQVDDDDAIDPPGNLAADAVYTFAVRDAAPQVLSPTVPLNAATVPNSQAVTLNFSEVVDLAAGSVLFNCGSAVAFTPALPQNNVSSVTLTPSAALPDGAACTVTLESTLVTDDDASIRRTSSTAMPATTPPMATPMISC